MRTPIARRHPHGFTILEAMLALSLLLIGTTGLLRLQVYGLASTQGARAYTTAEELARELAAGLAQLDYGDARLNPVGSGPTAPARFGGLLGVTDSTNVHSTAVDALPPGVRANTAVPGGYTRRWTVWSYVPTGGVPAVKFIAVSVVYQERSIQKDRETVVYLSRSDTSAVTANAAAFR